MRISHSGPMPSHHAEHISPLESLRWLSLGWNDFRRARSVALAYGLMVTLLGWLIFALGSHPYFIAAAVSGFLLLGPILGAGLIHASRALEVGNTPTFDRTLRDLDRNRDPLVRFALALLAIAAVWLMLSTLVLSAAMGPIAPGIEQTLWDSTLRFMTTGQVLAWAAIGAVLAVISFCVSVIAVPLIIDQQVSAGEAMRGSLHAVARQPLACAVWALSIVLLTAIGFATALLGFIVIYPLLGHASWHAYRALHD